MLKFISDNTGTIITIISILVTIVSIIVSIYFSVKANKFEKKLKVMDWNEVNIAMNKLYKKMANDKFKPDIIVAPGARGAILAELLLDRLSHAIPIYTGISLIWGCNDSNNASIDFNGYKKISNICEWNIFIPNAVFEIPKDKKVLIVDDFTVAGEFPEKVRKLFIDEEFDKNNIKTMYLIITYAVELANRKPDYYYKIAESKEYYFPWGEANTG